MNTDELAIHKNNSNERKITYFTLFTTSGTLICCALPILLVTLGLGGAVGAMTSALPFLFALSHYKIWIFIFSGTMLALSGWLMYRPGRACPTDPELGKKCSSAHKWNKRIYWTSVIIWSIGFFAAYLAFPLQVWFDSFSATG